MTARFILARHGNNFRPEDTPVWVGARSDLPLVEKGLAQAQAIADRLRVIAPAPAALITGPLQRTRQTAEIIADGISFPRDKIRIDDRLTEIDYGNWEGKATPEIIAMGDGDRLTAWNKNSVFPADVGWKPREAQIEANVGILMAEAVDGTSIIITSNGILRFFARAALNANSIADLKVATGRVCVMEQTAEGWLIDKWDQSPEHI